MSDKSTEIEDKLPNQLSVDKVIDNFLHRVLDIEDCASDFITIAAERYNEKADSLKSSMTKLQEVVEEDKGNLVALKDIRKTIRAIDRHNNTSHVDTLEKSMFIYLFSAFDRYMGDLIISLYQSQPNLYKNINREISLSEVLKYESMDELREEMLNKEIETLRRKSYIEQFKDLENKFSINLTKFGNWSLFVEASQRRNLFTHCDGIVSKQYCDICKDVKYKFKEEPIIGEQLTLGNSYFFNACQVVTEVAVMLGHTLWRKTQEENLQKADEHLGDLVYNFLHMEHWSNAILLSKFALGLPKISSELTEHVFTINYAIALKAIGKTKAAKNVLDNKDWSATIYEFRLAYAVLTEDYPYAYDMMLKIGEAGDFLTELAYHEWPLFKDFRDSEEFFKAYESIYGYEYVSKLTSLAKDKKSKVEDFEIIYEE